MRRIYLEDLSVTRSAGPSRHVVTSHVVSTSHVWWWGLLGLLALGAAARACLARMLAYDSTGTVTTSVWVSFWPSMRIA